MGKQVRRPAIFVALLMLGGTFAQAAEPGGRNPDLGTLGKPLLDMVAHGITTLSVMPAGGDDYDVLWATWGEDSVNPRTVHLALLHRHDSAAQPTWSMRRDGYSPTITPMDGWSFGTRGILLLQYQIGAASSHAEVYGIDTRSVPVVLGSLDGSLIESAQVGGALVIEVYQDAELQKAPTCWGWDSDRHRLAEVPCKAAPN